MKKNIIITILSLIIVALVVIFVISINNGTIKFSKTDNNDQQQTSTTNEVMSEESAIEIGSNLYDKATEIYSMWMLFPYCGYANIDNLKTYELGDSSYGNGSYYESEFSSLDELKKYLENYLSTDIVNKNVIESSQVNGQTYYNYVDDISLLSSSDDHYSYVDYVLKDSKLYCRAQSGKGWNSLYLDEYTMKPISILENKIEFNVTSTYMTNEAYQNKIEELTDEDKEYKDTTFVIEKINNKWIVTDYTLHE